MQLISCDGGKGEANSQVGHNKYANHGQQQRKTTHLLYSLHIGLITRHLMKSVIEENTKKLEPVFDGERPIGSTSGDAQSSLGQRLCHQYL